MTSLIPKYKPGTMLWQAIFDKEGCFIAVRRFMLKKIVLRAQDTDHAYLWYSGASGDVCGREEEMWPTEEEAKAYAYRQVRKRAGKLYDSVKEFAKYAKKDAKPTGHPWITDVNDLQAGMLALVDNIGWALLESGNREEVVVQPVGLTPDRQLDTRRAKITVLAEEIRMVFRVCS